MYKKIQKVIYKLICKYIYIKNYYKSSYEKRVLISYIIAPFYQLSHRYHSNVHEAFAIAEIFHDLGYIVDVVNFNQNVKVDFTKYDILFGFGETFENSFKTIFNGKRIYYATGAHVFFQNPAEVKRIYEVNRKFGAHLTPKRLVAYTWSASTGLSNALIILGNLWTKSTYEQYITGKSYSLNATGLYTDIDIKRDICTSRKGFLWFNSSGLVHKGLDLCLEVFSCRQDLELHICGTKEEDFFLTFNKYLNLPNIHFHGLVDIRTHLFQEICSKCLFSIFPSCSEGQSTSLITTMFYGFIPIATKETGVDIDIYGIKIESIKIESIKNAIMLAESYEPHYLIELSEKSKQIVKEKHTIDSFKYNFKNIISLILNNG
jgi:hypothetical protein